MMLKQNYSYFLLEIVLFCKEKTFAFVSEKKQNDIFIFYTFHKLQHLFGYIYLCLIKIGICFQ